jgi:valyl-tRNA synthetase
VIEFTDQIPFEDVYVHSIIQAPDGRRMSKSLGTGIDPVDLIEGGPRPPVFAKSPGGEPGEFPAYGADAVRWGLLAMSSGQDVRFSEDKVVQGQQLANKLWNASRLILLRVDPATRAELTPSRVEDRWILSRLHRARRALGERIERYDFSRAALELYDFVYAELCDWYLELVKPRLYEGDRGTAQTLLYVLTETLALAHPMIPFVTEEIYSHVPGAAGLLAGGLSASAQDELDEAAEASLERLIEAVQAVRAWRDSAEVRPGATLPARLAADGYEETADHLARMGKVELTASTPSADSDEPNPPDVIASIPIPGGTIEILASEQVDVGAADRKRAAARTKLEKEVDRSERKLANPGFVAKAPAEVVQAERDKVARLQAELAAL